MPLLRAGETEPLSWQLVFFLLLSGVVSFCVRAGGAGEVRTGGNTTQHEISHMGISSEENA